MTEEAKPTPRERELEKERCGICGLIHPFLAICPFIEEREIRFEFALDGNGRRRARYRTERTKYFPRPELFDALEEATTGVKPKVRPRKVRPRRKR